MKALDRKLLRDLWTLRMQVVSIALVMACGVAAIISCLSTYSSLLWSRGHYYDVARFPHVFATAKRVPAVVAARIAAIPGVVEVETRVVRDTQLSIPGVGPPMIARLIATDFAHLPGMNRLTLTAGRWPLAGARAEAAVNQRFLEARKLRLGDEVRVLLNGRLERVTLVGTALSPEFIYPTRGGGMPDDEWFGVLWMDADAVVAAYDMNGAFNSVLLRLGGEASLPGAIVALDTILEPYGGLGAIGRADHVSDKILLQEIESQRVFGIVLPAIFLAVSAFIVNVVLHRQVASQRAEIAALKALGYSSARIAGHYLEFAAVIVAIALAVGIAVGAWLGQMLTELYTFYFHFPGFHFQVPASLVALSAACTLACAVGGALAATRSILALGAAEAMRPEAPARFRPLLIERLGYTPLLAPSQRMIMRNLERKPLRALITVVGIAGSAAILVSGSFWSDSLERFMDVQFNKSMRSDIQVAFPEALPRGVRDDLARLPGVKRAEVARMVPVMLHAGQRSYRSALTGLADDAILLRIVDARARPTDVVPESLVLTQRLARRLGVGPGDWVHAQVLEGRRPLLRLRVAATARELAGMNAYMPLADLNHAIGDGDLVSAAQLSIARPDEDVLLARLKDTPAAAVVIVNRTLVETFRANNARNMLVFTSILTAFAAVIAVGVVYNNARIQLAERAWELASLRVLGFTRREVSVLLLGELALEIAVSIPVGLAAGYALAVLLVALMPHDVMELPLVISPRTYLYAAATVAAAGIASALVVRNRIDRLDLVAVLKTRE